MSDDGVTTATAEDVSAPGHSLCRGKNGNNRTHCKISSCMVVKSGLQSTDDFSGKDRCLKTSILT